MKNIRTELQLNLNQVDPKTQDALEKVFAEIKEKINSIFLKGLGQLSEFEDLKNFELRLMELGLDYLAADFNRFRKLAHQLTKTKDAYSTDRSIQIEDLIHKFIQINTYMRVFERVQSKHLVLQNIQNEIQKLSQIEADEEK